MLPVSMNANRLSGEKSPYLLQHADNPVDWLPWGEAAFKLAKDEDKPIFLSIGYSTCHWCHVMAHESFEDQEVATLLNHAFVCVKVDREERPDIDAIYMAVCQMMTGGGGWPLTIIMTPDKKPFFAATYIPKEGLFGSAGLLELIPQIQDMWKYKRPEVLHMADGIAAALGRRPEPGREKAPGNEQVRAAFEQLVESYDEKHGGFGSAPKFPMPHNILFLLRHWKRTGEKRALALAESTLAAMRRGGLWDHVGFGFHRYSTDDEWLVPHFEKMLYDQAMLAMAYIEAYQATKKEEYRTTAVEILEYVLRDLRLPGGGFCSAEDADSEGEEGKFYVWTAGELKAILGDIDYDLLAEVFNVSKDGNFYDAAGARKTARNILHLRKPLRELASRVGLSPDALEERVGKLRKKLLDARGQRTLPHRDDKVLADWNGLMIAALAKAARALGEGSYAEAARKAADFVLKEMVRSDRLLHRFRGGDAAVAGNLDDYSFFTWGLLELYEATFDSELLQRALGLNKQMLTHFWDAGAGGLYFTPDDGEKLLMRLKEGYDGALPSGNSVALHNLLRLARMTGSAELEKKAASILKAFGLDLDRNPAGHVHLLSALEFATSPTAEVVIAGKKDAPDTVAMTERLQAGYHPDMVVLYRNVEDEKDPVKELAPFTAGMALLDGRAAAHVCTDRSCQAPTSSPGKMLELLAAATASKE